MKDIIEVQNLWNSQPFLERLSFVMNKLKVSQDEGEKLAKLKFNKISLSQKLAIYQALN
jgi:hypothetical protein